MGQSPFYPRSDDDPAFIGQHVYVDNDKGRDSYVGLTPDRAKQTLQAAIGIVRPYGVIHLAPGTYAATEATIGRDNGQITIVGEGGRGAIALEAGTNGTCLTNLADDVAIVNVGLAGDGTGHAFVNYGRRMRIDGSKIEGGADGLRLTLATVAQDTAGTHGRGDDIWLKDCEFAYNTNGIDLVPTDFGAVTQVYIEDCVFHGNTKDITETLGSGATASVTFRNLTIDGCIFQRAEDGSQPMAYIDLNADNANTGQVSNCVFPTALAGGKNTVGTGLIWISNKHTGGISGAQPS